MDELYELQDNACEFLKRLKSKGNMSPADWELAHHVTATIKNIDKIMMAKHGGSHSRDGYSQAGRWRADMEGVYGHGNSYDDGYSQRRHRNDMGQYSRGDHSMNGYSQRGSIMSEMEELLRSANDKEREVLLRGISELKSF